MTAAQHADSATSDSFNWTLQGRVIVVDNGARLPTEDNFIKLMELNSLAVVAFDPASRLKDDNRLENLEEFQLFPHALLGDGQPTTLYACLSSAQSGTLEPVTEWQPAEQRKDSQVLARLPINTITLNSIEGLSSIDWLILDELNDNHAILENGNQALQDTLLFQVRLPFLPTRRGQLDFAKLNRWMTRHGFQFYRLNDAGHASYFPQELELEHQLATRMTTIDALFTPTEQRLDSLPPERLEKLAFLMDTRFHAHDFAYALLERQDRQRARTYLISRGYLSQYHEEPDTFTLTAADSPVPW